MDGTAIVAELPPQFPALSCLRNPCMQYVEMRRGYWSPSAFSNGTSFNGVACGGGNNTCAFNSMEKAKDFCDTYADCKGVQQYCSVYGTRTYAALNDVQTNVQVESCKCPLSSSGAELCYVPMLEMVFQPQGHHVDADHITAWMCTRYYSVRRPGPLNLCKFASARQHHEIDSRVCTGRAVSQCLPNHPRRWQPGLLQHTMELKVFQHDARWRVRSTYCARVPCSGQALGSGNARLLGSHPGQIRRVPHVPRPHGHQDACCK